MDLQNCLNFQRELLYLPPTVNQWQTLHNVTETLPTQRNLHAGRNQKKKQKKKLIRKKSKINHTDKNKQDILYNAVLLAGGEIQTFLLQFGVFVTRA